MDFAWLIVFAGALVGLAVGMTGMGGGALLTPIMVLLFGVNPSAAVGSDLAVSVAMKPVGAVVHHRAGTVRWDIVRWLLPTAVPAGFLGAWLVSLFGAGAEFEDRLKVAIGAALLLAVAGMAVRPMLARRREGEPPGVPVVARPVPTLLIGLAGGLIVGITSVGSGSLIIVMLMLTHPRLRPSELVGTDLVQAIPLVLSAAIGHLIFGDTRLALAGTVLLGAIPGIYAGAKLATRVPDGALRWVLAVLLVGSGLSLWDAPNLLIILVCAALAGIGAARAIARRRLPSSGTADPSPDLVAQTPHGREAGH